MNLQNLYSTEINLPFRANVHPLLTSNATLEKLIKIGLKRTCVGIQSGSYRVRKEIFNRNISNNKIIGFCEILDNSNVFYSVHIIGWNPLEFIDDYEEGLQLFLNLKPETDVKIFRLQVFPGSKLEEKFKERNKDSLPDKIPLPDKIHLYYAYLFSYIFNNKRSRQFGLKNHISITNEHINEKLNVLISKKEEFCRSSSIESELTKLMFSKDTPRNRLLGYGYSEKDAKCICMSYGEEYILDVLNTSETLRMEDKNYIDYLSNKFMLF